jgi:acetylornithine deacetylase/succinyl-diaminopimelate desuccinylase-like protein
MWTLLRRHLDAHGFTGIGLRPLSERYPGKVPFEHPMVQAIIRTGREFYGTPPAIYPVAPWIGAPYHELADPLGIPLVNAGMGSAEAQFHAPNEGLNIGDYGAGVAFTAALFGDLAGAI